MKRLFLCLFLVACSYILLAQTVIISGKEGNRPLVWADFKGAPDGSSPYFALTYWNLSYKVDKVQFINNKVVIGKFEVLLELNPKGSWVKKGKETNDLLKHEQGHFNTGILCLREFLKRKKQAVFTPKNFGQQMEDILNDTIKKYHDMGERYDAETNHSQNTGAQLKWDAFFAEQLAL
jgi:hypothetical protein